MPGQGFDGSLTWTNLELSRECQVLLKVCNNFFGENADLINWCNSTRAVVACRIYRVSCNCMQVSGRNQRAAPRIGSTSICMHTSSQMPSHSGVSQTFCLFLHYVGCLLCLHPSCGLAEVFFGVSVCGKSCCKDNLSMPGRNSLYWATLSKL